MKEQRSIPVVVISKTFRPLPELEFVIKQAKKNNSDVFLLGDEGNSHYAPDNHRKMSDYDEGVTEFEELYQHLSTNHEGIEKFCFSRWFIFRNFLRKHDYEGAFYIDNDILFFGNATSEFEQRKHLYCTLSGRSSGHSSYWTLEGIEAFCAYLMEVYSNKEAYEYARLASHFHVRQHFGLPGGLCDMTLLEAFARYKFPHLVGECSVAFKDGWYYDHVIHEPEGFEHKDGIKQFKFIKGVPHSLHKKLEKEIPFATIHFQGPNKPLIEKFYRMCDDSFI
jgi:hypothetical protein